MEEKRELQELYKNVSKHSNYQILPKRLKEYIAEEELQIKSRNEQERLKYILEKVDVKGKKFCDIGCNCGYFSFELIECGAAEGTLYEGNPVHARFVEKAAEILQLEKQIKVCSEYFDFEDVTDLQERERRYDFILLLNVLHHVGDDYGDAKDIEDAKVKMLEQLNGMSKITDTLIFQLGFNWKGNRERCLFPNGTKQEMIQWLEDGIKEYWSVEAIGVAERRNAGMLYCDLNENNIKREDSLGEFLNRPIFILKAKNK